MVSRALFFFVEFDEVLSLLHGSAVHFCTAVKVDSFLIFEVWVVLGMINVSSAIDTIEISNLLYMNCQWNSPHLRKVSHSFFRISLFNKIRLYLSYVSKQLSHVMSFLRRTKGSIIVKLKKISETLESFFQFKSVFISMYILLNWLILL